MKMMKHIIVVFLFLMAFPQLMVAKDYHARLTDVAKVLNDTRAGDRIFVEDGCYNDAELKWVAKGDTDKPVSVLPAHPGQVIISGHSTLKIAGNGLLVQGLWFKDGYTDKSTVVEFRVGKLLASNCRLSQCVIDNYNPRNRSVSYSYIHLYGHDNRIDHCSFMGKKNLGVTVIVMLNMQDCLNNHHRIDHNYFGPRPVYGSNGAETIRIGTSQQAMMPSHTIVEDNLFDRCNGEVEVVSVKSCDNVIRHNTFYECQGILALRHGNGNSVQGNTFVGNGIRNTGGIRVINEGHVIENNVMIGLAGSRFFSAFAVMDGVPNSLPNRYNPVRNVMVRNNHFQDCSHIEFGTGRDLERTQVPVCVTFMNNEILNKTVNMPFFAIDSVDHISMQGNRCELATQTHITGFKDCKVKRLPTPDYHQLRSEVGAEWLKSEKQQDTAVTNFFVADNVEKLQQILQSAKGTTTIYLNQEKYMLTSGLKVSSHIYMIGRTPKGSKPMLMYAGEKPDNMITISDGGHLRISNVAFSGELAEGKALAIAGISTANSMIDTYSLEVDSCEFADFGEGGFFPIRGLKSTFADSIVIRNSLFRNLSGDAINYAAENDDMGRYSADDIVIDNCAFYHMLGTAINIYRGGSDESTAGPYVNVTNCNFADCCNKERGSVMRLIGPQIMKIAYCNFDNSGRGGVSIRLDEATWEDVKVEHCNFWNSGRILNMTPNSVVNNQTAWQPVYENAQTFDFRQNAHSPLTNLKIGIK
jgi:poly(beta-D-mannuronate) lyase